MVDQSVLVFQNDLAPGEELLWSGRPGQGIRLRPNDLFLIPFSLLWGGFAVFWESQVIASNAPGFFICWGIPFLLVAVYLIVGRFFVDATQRRHQYYAVTNRRAIIVSDLFGRKIKSLNLLTLSDISVNERQDGSGTITFGPVLINAALSAGMSWPGVPKPPSFEMLPDVRNVYDIIQQAQQQVLQPAASTWANEE